MTAARFCDELDDAFGWITDERIPRTGHALATREGVWLVDPVAAPGVEERVTGLGEPRGVIQLLDRHERDCAELAGRLHVPHFRVPLRGVAGSPFRFVPIVRSRFWLEVALWWPERRVLVCADSLGTLGYFVAPGERLGVHPLLRIRPPSQLRTLEPVHVLCGHGEGVHGDEAAPALREALATARRRLLRAYAHAATDFARRSRG